MSSLSLQDIVLRPAQLKAVKKLAKHLGQTAPEFVRLLVERELLANSTFDEILLPIRQDFKNKAVSEVQLDDIVTRARRSKRRTELRHGTHPRGKRK